MRLLLGIFVCLVFIMCMRSYQGAIELKKLLSDKILGVCLWNEFLQSINTFAINLFRNIYNTLEFSFPDEIV